eukprot:1395208-Amorphochlora_amoeboformis.AAC.1
MGLTYRRGLLRRWGVAHVVVLGVILCFGVPGKRHPRLGEEHEYSTCTCPSRTRTPNDYIRTFEWGFYDRSH